MKQIGDEQFAIKFELHPTTGDRELDDMLYGRIYFLVDNANIGNTEGEASLNIGTVEVARILANRGRRNRPELMHMPAEDLFRTVFSALAEDTGQSNTQVAQDWATYSPLIAIPRFEPFDEWDAFLVEDAQRARFIWRHTSESASQVHEKSLRPGQLDDTLKGFLDEMRRLAPEVVTVT